MSPASALRTNQILALLLRTALPQKTRQAEVGDILGQSLI
jgi:hypothetical protein